MYRVVIIDDEPIIVEGLKKSIHWEEKQCRVVGTAFSGDEGLKLILVEKPDIVISDICMPNMDGLAMIAAIKSQFPDTEVAILTGFRDFDYAQRAIRLGVCRFLLKPSKLDEIYEALDFMTEKLGRLKAEQAAQAEKAAKAEQALQEGGAVQGEVYIDAVEGVLPDCTSQADPVMDNAASSFIVKNALHYIEENYKEKLKLSDVADKVFVSQWHLSKLLNRHTGQNFSEILNGVRIEKAKELLKNPSLRVGDIAEEVGFLDIAHFSRVFKKTVGISANDYRNTL